MMLAVIMVVTPWHSSTYDDDVFKALSGDVAAVAVCLNARLIARLRT